MKTKVYGILFLFCLIWFTGCDSNSDPKAGERGAITSTSLIETRTSVKISADLGNLGFPLLGTYDVEVHKFIYDTIDGSGNATKASGVVLIPKNGPKTMSMMVYQRGTIAKDSEAPSQSSTFQTLGIAYATSGYVTVMPDLLGFGDSTIPIHPYVIAKPTATASIDLMRAARTYCKNNKVSLNGRVLLTGYSQGGYSAMALHKVIQEEYKSEFNVIASAPMAGPYDLSGTMLNTVLANQPHPNPFFFAFVALAFNDQYKFAATNADMFNEPYATNVPPLFAAGTYSGSDINAKLPASRKPLDMFKTSFVDIIKSATNPVKTAFAANDVYNWKPTAPVQMYHCAADDNVPYQNSVIARDKMQALGAKVTLVDPYPAGTHGSCFGYASYQSKIWLDQQNNDYK
jgi:pimeloyl-ACP methyl ester carboxylesterase